MSRKWFYIVTVGLLAVLLSIKIFDISYKGKVVANEQYKIEQNEWNKVVSDSINAKEIQLFVDGKDVTKASKKFYFNENRTLMIPADKVTSLFECAYNEYGKDKIVIEKGLSTVVIGLNDETNYVNDEKYEFENEIVKVDDVTYIPQEVFEKIFGYICTFDTNTNIATMVNSKVGESTIPYYYDYRVSNRMPDVKDQGKFSACWAFAALTALESSIMPDIKYDFSQEHMVLNNPHLVSMLSGGTYTMAISYLAAWKGPVLAIDDAYGDYYTPGNLKPVVHVQEIQIIESKDFAEIKKTVFLYGGVQSSIYTSLKTASSYSQYYNREKAAYCYKGEERPNHDIVIVGWDDNYPKENFTKVPEGDGAFICQNSWGTAFGDDGIFYVSYYDSNIGVNNLVYTGVEPNDNYDNIYQSDMCGWVGQAGFSSEQAYFANVYKANSDETLEAVSFYATGKDTEYEVYFVENFNDEASSLNNRRLLTNGKFENAGYYTVKIDEEILLTEGKKYAVIVRIKTPNTKNPIAVEYRAGYSTSITNINDGESYISSYGRVWENVEATKKWNVCLKMFTNKVEEKQ